MSPEIEICASFSWFRSYLISRAISVRPRGISDLELIQLTHTWALLASALFCKGFVHSDVVSDLPMSPGVPHHSQPFQARRIKVGLTSEVTDLVSSLPLMPVDTYQLCPCHGCMHTALLLWPPTNRLGGFSHLSWSFLRTLCVNTNICMICRLSWAKLKRKARLSVSSNV